MCVCMYMYPKNIFFKKQLPMNSILGRIDDRMAKKTMWLQTDLGVNLEVMFPLRVLKYL